MGLADRVFQLMAEMLLERPVRDKTLPEFRKELEETGQNIQRQLGTADETQKNRDALRHIICIERWSQQRVKAALGEPFVMDESDGYLPAAEITWDQLQGAFRETRQETLALVRKLDEANVGRDLRVRHNQWGNLTVYGWLNYMNGHANRDAKGFN
jgi:hypothetical protein